MADKKETKTKAEPKKETVSVEKSELEGFLLRLESLEKENKKLLEVADKARLARVEARDESGAILIRKVKVSRLGASGPIIKEWKLKVNEAYAVKGQILEKQIVQVTFEDGEKKDLDLVDFYRMQNKDTIGEIKSRKKETGGDEILELVLEDGKEIEIGLAYVN